MLKDLIKNIIRQNKSIVDFRNQTSEKYQNGEEVIQLITSELETTKFNPQISQDLAELLQLSDDGNLNTQFDLADISKLYDSLRKLQEANLDTFIESAHFEFSVMDNPKKAKDIADEGIQLAKQKLQELEALLTKIDEELK